MRLIDADALMADIECTIENSGCVNHEGEIMDCVRYAPEVDAVPVVRGEWRWHEEWRESTSDGPAECQSAGYVCSACGIELSEYLSESLGEIIYADIPEETPKITFCPNRGAKIEDKP